MKSLSVANNANVFYCYRKKCGAQDMVRITVFESHTSEMLVRLNDFLILHSPSCPLATKCLADFTYIIVFCLKTSVME